MRVILYALCSLLVLSRMKHSTCKGMRQSGLKFRKIAFWMTLCYVGSCARAACLPDEFTCTNDECIPVESQCDRYNDCGDNSDEVGCICYTGDIRLLGGQSAAEGTMELCSLNTWAATCGEYFSGDDARVICRQLGFNSSIARYNSFYGRGSSIYTWGNVVGGCIGNESMLLYCPRNPSAYTCSRDELAGVQCSIPYCPSPNFQCANSLCIDYNYRCDGYNDCRDNSDEQNCSCYRGSVRLVGGESPAEGTLEVCNANTWGTICDSLWNANDTRVVCRQLGYTNASIHISKSLFGHGTTATTWKTIGGCRGTESSLTSCRFTAPVSCNNTSLAGARCFECSGSEYYLCANARCISSKHRCDSVDNCGDGSDEANCDLPTISSIAFVVRKREGMSWALIGGVAGGIVGELAFVFLLGICIVIGVRYHRRHKRAVKITSETHAASALQLESAVCDMPARSSEILNLQIMSVPNFPELSAAPTVVTSSVAPAIQETSSSSITPPSAQEVVNASAVYDVMSAQIASAIDELTTMQVSFASNNPLLQSNTACSQEQDQVPSLQLLPHIVASENC